MLSYSRSLGLSHECYDATVYAKVKLELGGSCDPLQLNAPQLRRKDDEMR